jgi:hypothetical protein
MFGNNLAAKTGTRIGFSIEDNLSFAHFIISSMNQTGNSENVEKSSIFSTKMRSHHRHSDGISISKDSLWKGKEPWLQHMYR